MSPKQITSTMKANELTTVLIVEDYEINSISLAKLLESEAPIKVLGRSSNMADARQMFKKHANANIVLMDLNLEDQNKHTEPEGLILAREIIQSQDILAYVIAVTQYIDGRWISRAYDMGIKGYLNKNCSLEELLEAIEEVQKGKIYYKGKVRDEMDNYQSNRKFAKEDLRLTGREQQVLEYLAEGFTTQEIAEIMKIKPNTVETYRASLLRKFDAENVAHLIQLAFRLGFLR